MRSRIVALLITVHGFFAGSCAAQGRGAVASGPRGALWSLQKHLVARHAGFGLCIATHHHQHHPTITLTPPPPPLSAAASLRRSRQCITTSSTVPGSVSRGTGSAVGVHALYVLKPLVTAKARVP